MATNDAAASKVAATERVEESISYGRPTCDVCRETHHDDRDEAGEFWPDTPIHYVRNDARRANEFWGKTLCQHHEELNHIPSGATHRVVDNPEYIGDEHRMNSAYKHRVAEVRELPE